MGCHDSIYGGRHGQVTASYLEHIALAGSIVHDDADSEAMSRQNASDPPPPFLIDTANDISLRANIENRASQDRQLTLHSIFARLLHSPLSTSRIRRSEKRCVTLFASSHRSPCKRIANTRQHPPLAPPASGSGRLSLASFARRLGEGLGVGWACGVKTGLARRGQSPCTTPSSFAHHISIRDPQHRKAELRQHIVTQPVLAASCRAYRHRLRRSVTRFAAT